MGFNYRKKVSISFFNSSLVIIKNRGVRQLNSIHDKSFYLKKTNLIKFLNALKIL